MPEEPDIWAIKVVCSHPPHTNFSQKVGKQKTIDAIEVVPGSSGDKLTLTTTPDGVASWQIGSKKATGSEFVFTVPNVPMAKPKPWTLAEVTPETRTIHATRDGATHTCTLNAYPDAAYKVDLEPYRKLIRDGVWAIPLKVIKTAASVFTEDFELEVLEKKDFAGKLATQWKEFNGAGGTSKDFRAYLDFLLDFKADPLIRNKFEMEFSVGKLLKKLKKVGWLKKKIDKLPKRLRTAVDAIKLTGTSEISGGGRQRVRSGAPGAGLPRLGPDTASQVEFDGSYSIKWVADIDLEELFSDKDRTEIGAVRISIDFGFDFTMGLILDLEEPARTPGRTLGMPMPARYVAALEHTNVPVHVSINGVPLSRGTPATSKGFWQLEPFVADGSNTLTLEIDAPKPNASVIANVQTNASGGWSVVAKKDLLPAGSGSVQLEFTASDAAVPDPKAERISALSEADRDTIAKLLARVHSRVSDDPGGELIELFEHRLGYCERVGDIGRSELEAQLLDDFADLADATFTPPPASPAKLELVCGNTLCVPLGADGQHWLHAKSGGSGLVFPLALGRVGGQWRVVG